MPQTTITPGTRIAYTTDSARRRGVAVSVGGGFVLAALGLVRTDRPEGVEVDREEPLSTTPFVLPLDAVEVIA